MKLFLLFIVFASTVQAGKELPTAARYSGGKFEVKQNFIFKANVSSLYFQDDEQVSSDELDKEEPYCMILLKNKFYQEHKTDVLGKNFNITSVEMYSENRSNIFHNAKIKLEGTNYINYIYCKNAGKLVMEDTLVEIFGSYFKFNYPVENYNGSI